MRRKIIKWALLLFLGPVFEDFALEIVEEYKDGGQHGTATNARHWFRALGKVFNGRRVRKLNSDMFYKEYVPYARVHRPNVKLNEERKFFVRLLLKAHKDGITKEVPRYIPMPDKAGIRKAASDDDVAKALKACRNDKMKFQIRVWALTGFRPSEVLKLRWSWFDLSNGTITFPSSFTKTRTERTVYIPDTLMTEFLELHKTKVSDCVFPSRLDPNKPQTMNKRSWREMELLSGVKLCPYNLRHYSATKKARAGIERKLIVADMGTSLRMLDKHYDHVYLEDRKKVANVLKIPKSK